MKPPHKLCIEGGGNTRGAQAPCREAFRELLVKAGFSSRSLQVAACGSRNNALKEFRIALSKAKSGDFVALLVDSEAPIADIEKTWAHLKAHDYWDKPEGVTDEQVLLMTTCMETWIVADRSALEDHYGAKLQVSALPPLQDLETRNRHDVQDQLEKATRNCTNAYKKGKRSFVVLATLDPEVLSQHLPSFARVVRILNQKLPPRAR